MVYCLCQLIVARFDFLQCFCVLWHNYVQMCPIYFHSWHKILLFCYLGFSAIFILFSGWFRGGAQGGRPSYFYSKQSPEGPNKFIFGDRPPPPPLALLFSRSRSGTAFGIKNCDNFGHCNTFDCLYSEVCWGVYLLELAKNTLMIMIMIMIIIMINNIHRIQSSTYSVLQQLFRKELNVGNDCPLSKSSYPPLRRRSLWRREKLRFHKRICGFDVHFVLYFVTGFKSYAGRHVKITRHWKSTLMQVLFLSPFFLHK